MKTSRREFMLEMQRHHLARLEMMLAEERGEKLSYEEALKNGKS